MSSIKVDSKIPFPKNPNGKRGRPTKYPWGDLETGDSFAVETWDAKRVNYYYQLGKSWAERNKPEVEFRPGKYGNQLRIWRTA